MAQLNPGLIMGAVPQAVPLNNLAQTYSNSAVLAQHMDQLQQIQEAQRQRQLMNDAYASSTDVNGNVDQGKFMSYLAQNQGGAAIPAAQKSMLENQKARADIAKTQSDTATAMQTQLHKSLDLVSNSIAGLASDPNTNERTVFGEMGRLVNAGAFDIQAQHQGVSPDEYAKGLLSTMPVGNPNALHNWLIQQGLRVTDASQRMKLLSPEYNAQDQGGVINEGTINPLTGQRTAGVNVAKTNTPGELLSAQTTRRGQDIADARQKQTNEIAQEAAQSQIQDTPQGFQVINKGTGIARPVMTETGQPVLPANSQVAKNAQMVNRLQELLPTAEALLKGATSSGLGSMVDKAMAFTGNSTSGSEKAAALKAISGWMTSNVPRFEGPQSDKDVQNYQTMAGMIGDDTQPLKNRQAALEALKVLISKYSQDQSLGFSGPPGTTPPAVVPPRPLVPNSDTSAVPRRRSTDQPAGRPALDSFFLR